MISNQIDVTVDVSGNRSLVSGMSEFGSDLFLGMLLGFSHFLLTSGFLALRILGVKVGFHPSRSLQRSQASELCFQYLNALLEMPVLLSKLLALVVCLMALGALIFQIQLFALESLPQPFILFSQ
jgi:hypothetical protein